MLEGVNEMKNNNGTLVTELSAESFDHKVLANGLALVDFWADWCGPCRTLGPIVEKVATQNPESLDVFKVNVDDYPELAQRFEIRGIPTLLLFQDGELVERIIGVQPAAAIQGIIEGIRESRAVTA
jgi:thioredoxin 1